MNYREFGLNSGRRFTRSQVVLLTARAVSTYWTTRHRQLLDSSVQRPVTACALLLTLFSAQFLVHFFSNGGDHGLRVITAAAVRLWCLLVCLLVTSWPPRCDESTAWRVHRVTSWPCDELTGSLFKASFESGIIPQDWKTATVTPIFNKGSRTDPANYQPLTSLILYRLNKLEWLFRFIVGVYR